MFQLFLPIMNSPPTTWRRCSQSAVPTHPLRRRTKGYRGASPYKKIRTDGDLDIDSVGGGVCHDETGSPLGIQRTVDGFADIVAFWQIQQAGEASLHRQQPKGVVRFRSGCWPFSKYRTMGRLVLQHAIETLLAGQVSCVSAK